MAKEPKSAPFNGADPAKFDHDGDGQPGGSLAADASAARVPYIAVDSGVLVLWDPAAADPLDPGLYKLATAQDVTVAGRPDLVDAVVTPPSPAPDDAAADPQDTPEA